MANRLSDAMNKLNVEGSRNSLGRPPPSPGAKRNSGLDPSTINAMFPDAAAALATQKAAFTQKTGNPPSSNRNSAVYDNRSSLNAPTISTPLDSGRESLPQPPTSPWGIRSAEVQLPIARPKSSSDQQPMGQFTQPPPSAGLRSPRPPQLSGNTNLQSTTIHAPESRADLSILSPYNAGLSWSSNVNTPMTANFQHQPNPPSVNQADMVANATAMKLAALSTVNNRIALDDVRKYRRGRSENAASIPAGMSGTNIVMVNEQGQVLSGEQVAALQAQASGGMRGRRSRPSSPGLGMQGSGGFNQMSFTSPQNNGFLAAYDGTSPLINNGMGTLSMNSFGLGPGSSHEGYLSDHSDIGRGRSPRGRRGSSKAPEDPTDPSLLQDIPNWLRSLRLHKYTDNLKDLKWTDLVELDDAGLEKRGVAAVGARRKMLKVS